MKRPSHRRSFKALSYGKMRDMSHRRRHTLTNHTDTPGPVLVKLGSTLPQLAHSRGDFEDWIVRGMGCSPSEITLVNPTLGDPLPPPDSISGVIVTGSHAMVTDHAPWSEQTALWLRSLVHASVPVLGICYGHQLLAYTLGGKVDDNPRGMEFGTVAATLMPEAETDRLLGGLDTAIEVQVCHTQSVLQLPNGARLLARSDMDPNLAYAIGACAWGVQFHPEFDAQVMSTYTEAYRDALTAAGKDPEAILRSIHDTPIGDTIMRRFTQMLTQGDSA